MEIDFFGEGSGEAVARNSMMSTHDTAEDLKILARDIKQSFGEYQLATFDDAKLRADSTWFRIF